jgi:hypothetical protein
MRHLKTAFGLVVVVCLLGTMTATALGHEFVASKYKTTISPETPVTTKGKAPAETKQEMTFSKYHLKCGAAYSKGTITEPVSTVFKTHMIYSKCGLYPYGTSEVHFPATVKGGLSVAFKVNGAAELEGNESGEELEYGTKAEVLETATVFQIPGGKFCTIVVPTQIVPARAIKHPEEEFAQVLYSNDPVKVEETPTKLKLYPGGFQHKVIFTMDLKPLKFQFKEETQCFEDEAKTQGSGGIIKGAIVEEVVGGNLEFH